LVHAFSVNGDYLALDTETGSLHLLDELSFLVLKAYIEAGGQRPEASALCSFSEYPHDDIYDVCSEIETLISEGSLFAAEENIEIGDFYPDKPRIKAMCLHLCHDCNLRCGYCFANTGDYNTGHRNFLSYETGKNAVDFIVESSGPRRNIDIDFFGGEPLMNWDIVVKLTGYCEEQSKLKGKNIRLTITTNAVLLDDEKSEFINDHMENCVLSMDGRKFVQDQMRPAPNGKGSYEIVKNNILNFINKREDGTYYVRGTYTRKNLDFSEDVRHIVSLGAKHVSVEPVVGPEDSDYSIRDEDLPRIFQEYEILAKDMSERCEDDRFEFFHFSIDLDGGPCAYKRLKGCGVGTEYVAVTPDGDIYPCHQLTGETEFLMGNVNDKPVVLNDLVSMRFSKLLVPQKTECNICWAKYYCSGGCPANAYHDTGDINGVYEKGCLIQKKRLECALWLKAMRVAVQ